MANIHVGQTAIRLQFKIGLDISLANSIELRFYKPNGMMGSFPASILDASVGEVYYDVQSETDLDDTGYWTFWVHVWFSDNTELDSDPIKVSIFEPGKDYISYPYGKIGITSGN